jgi:hypothetical protein
LAGLSCVVVKPVIVVGVRQRAVDLQPEVHHASS